MSDVDKTIEAVWKIESTRLIAAIARVTHDIGIAEELAQDALVTALEVWPEQGIPGNPGAWLMKAAKRRAIDSLRRGRMLVQKHEEIAFELEWQQQRLGDALDHSLDQVIDDDVLRLIFSACHPVHAVEGRIALTLRLTTAEIALAFLVPEGASGSLARSQFRSWLSCSRWRLFWCCNLWIERGKSMSCPNCGSNTESFCWTSIAAWSETSGLMSGFPGC